MAELKFEMSAFAESRLCINRLGGVTLSKVMNITVGEIVEK